MSIERALDEMGLSIPPEPKTQLLAGHQVGRIVTTSGRTSPQRGRVGLDVSVSDAKVAARDATVRALGAVRVMAGSLERMERVLRVDGFVNCTSEFTATSSVIDGASDLIYRLLGEDLGRHSRIAVGAAALPNGASVEVVLTVSLHGTSEEGGGV